MKRGTVVAYLISILWAVLVVMWPESSNENLAPGDKQVSGEGLYKSSLTKANFGLLGVRFYQTQSGRKRWKINSEFAELHRKENYAFLEEVTAEFNAGKTGNT